MTASAGARLRQVVTRKCSSSVVTLQAVISGGRPVLQDRDVCHLTALGSARDDAMTFAAVHTLPGSMIRMSEDGLEIVLGRQCSTIRGDLMTDVAAADLALGRMTRVAIVMSIES